MKGFSEPWQRQLDLNQRIGESKSPALSLGYSAIYSELTRRARNASVFWNQHPTTFSLLSRFPPCARRLEPRKRYIEYGFNSNNEDGGRLRCRSPHHSWCQPISSRCLPPGKIIFHIVVSSALGAWNPDACAPPHQTQGREGAQRSLSTRLTSP